MIPICEKIDFSKLTKEDFVWEKDMARPVMYCYRISDYGKINESETFDKWCALTHSYSTDRDWFHGLYQYMLSVIDKCKEIGYDAYKEVNVRHERKN